jgi:hypothetical protein
MYIKTTGDLNTNLHHYLPRIPDNLLFYKEYGIKHPIALYNISIGKLDSAILSFLEVYENFNESPFEEVDKKHAGALLKTYKDVLYALREYLDDSFMVAKTVVRPDTKHTDVRNQFLWLKNNIPSESDTLIRCLAEYKQYIDKSVNELKHNNAFLGGFSFYSLQTGKHCLGYYIANVRDDACGPVEDIHPLFMGQHTGFSFRRDLHYNYYNVYYISELLIDFIKNITNIDSSNLSPLTLEPREEKKKIAEMMTLMPPIHFPNEYPKSVPSVALLRSRRLKLEYPSSFTIESNNLERAVMTSSTDGHTRTYKMLYMRDTPQ